MSGPVLRGPRVVVRPLRTDDAPALAAIGRHPEVARWWPAIDEHELAAKAAGEGEVVALAIELEGAPVGLVQWYEERDPDYPSAGLDVFLDPALRGRGLAPEALWLVARHLVETRGHHRLTIDPAAANEAAIRAYAKVGFRPVGVMRAYQRLGERFEDGLLMDLLAEELAPEPPGPARGG